MKGLENVKGMIDVIEENKKIKECLQKRVVQDELKTIAFLIIEIKRKNASFWILAFFPVSCCCNFVATCYRYVFAGIRLFSVTRGIKLCERTRVIHYYKAKR
jgi:hypothetical protein